MSAFMSTNEPTFDIETVPEHHKAFVLSLIPDPRLADGYVHRDPLPGVYDFQMLDDAMNARENVFLEGPTGSSKTTLFRAYCAARRLPLAVVECSANMDPKSVLGRRDIDRVTGLPVWLDAPHTIVIRYGGCVLYDEVTLAHPRVTAAFHGVTSVMRRLDLQENGETIRAGHGGIGEAQPVLLAAATNPRSYRGTSQMNQAFANRFPVTVKWPYLREVEEQMVTSTTLLDIAWAARDLAEVQSPVSTNMLIEFERHVHMWNIDAAIEVFVNHFDDDEVNPIRRALEAHSVEILAEVMGEVADVEVDADGVLHGSDIDGDVSID